MNFIKVKGGIINFDSIAFINSDENYISLNNGDVIHMDEDAMEKLIKMIAFGEIGKEGGRTPVFKNIY